MKFNSIFTLKRWLKPVSTSRGRVFGKMRCAFLASLLVFAPQNGLLAQELLTPVERSVPEFALKGVDGTEWNTDSLLGKLWVVNFWATWCPPCIEEIPSMNKAWEVLEPEGIGMLAINAGEDRFAVEEFLGKIPIEFPTVLGSMDSMANWSARALPTTLVINEQGQVVFEALGPREWDDAELLQKIIDLQ